MTIQEYIDKVNTRYKQGNSTEHTFRGDLQTLLETLLPEINVTNEPQRIKCGAPDYILSRKEIPIGYIEAKDLGADLNSKGYKDQFTRYKEALPNLIITNYLDFQLYKDGALVATYSIGTLADGKVTGKSEQYEAFTAMIKDFSTHIGQTIRSAQKLAAMMANKAKLLASVIGEALESDEETTANSTLQEQYKAFQDILIHDITSKGFADIYAQTIAYGMFAARLHDPSLDTFSRQEAAELIPKSNPFLRKLFQYIAGYDLDQRIVWIVDALADIFRATDVAALLKNFGKATKQHDPIIHFYETFLSEYDPKLRKSRGVWYTPEPVVNFIVRAVDDILKTEFGLKDGLADTSKVKVKRKVQSKATADQRSKLKEVEIEEEVHRVQILDPATGTGTFLAEVIRQIHEKFSGQQGIWSSYVEKHLIPRINGFELLMASYAMAHLKLDMLLTETGYKTKTDQRLRVYLTNSLEEHHPDTGTLFANWLSTEANEANQIKRDTPVMAVIGNPPYLGESNNKGKWIMNLMEDYKKEPNSKEKLKERNPKWINADENKFIRYGQHFIERNGSGILAFINPHSYLDNPTLRGMRWNLLKTFNKCYIVDLHGNSTKKETSPNGTADVNVFDIMQGVCINIFIKTGKNVENQLAEVYNFDLYGKREDKYDFLFHNSLATIPFKSLDCQAPMYFMVQKEFEPESDYLKWISVIELFPVNNVGIVTSRDRFVIDENEGILKDRIEAFFSLSKDEILRCFGLKENKTWKIDDVKISANKYNVNHVKTITYRPFDNSFVYYSKDFIERSRADVMQHFIRGDNVGLIIGRQGQVVGNMQWNLSFISNDITDFNIFYRGGGNSFPIYQYTSEEIFGVHKRKPNLNETIVNEIADGLGLTFTNEKEDTPNTFAPIDILDYIYAVLHSPTYRERYKEFLKIDFPRVPYPTDKAKFWQLVQFGGEIRQIHLLESPTVTKLITSYPVDGSNEVEKPDYKDGKVWINTDQYFDSVPEVAWQFYIGGYQPAQKWLKDRKGRELSIDDILHYQKIIVALTETDRLMKEIDKIEIV